jgi:hypothetical protein
MRARDHHKGCICIFGAKDGAVHRNFAPAWSFGMGHNMGFDVRPDGCGSA